MATPTDSVRTQLRTDLTSAMKARDTESVRTLRTLLAAIANAEAPPIESAPTEVHGRLVQHERIALTGANIDAILRAEIVDRTDTAVTYAANGRTDEADVIHREIALIEHYLR